MIRSFADRDTERVWRRESSKRLDPRIHKTMNRKLHLLPRHRSTRCEFLQENRLEALKGDRAGQHSIRADDQWRICFRWTRRRPGRR